MYTKAQVKENQQVDWVDSATCIVGGLILLGTGLRKRSWMRMAIGGYLAYKGISGNRTLVDLYNRTAEKISEATASGKAINTRLSMVINRPRAEVWAFWRNLSNLPLFMEHLLLVKERDEIYSEWELQLPGNLGTLHWDAEIVKEREGEMLAWRSLPGSAIQNAGKVSFSDALGKQGTAVDIVFSYHAPLGEAGEKLARLFNPVFQQVIESDIRNFKNFVEAGLPQRDPAVTGVL